MLASQQKTTDNLPRGNYELLWLLIITGCCYARCFTWGWLDFDDRVFELHSPFWGAGYTNSAPLWSALTGGINHRWLPVFDLFLFFVPRSLFWLHFAVFGLCIIIALLVRLVAIRYVGPKWGFWITLAWMVQPARLEIFGWTMGIVYELMIIGTLLCFLSSSWRSGLWALFALAAYPACAGGLLLIGIINGGLKRYTVISAVVLVFVVDLLAGVHGFHEVKPWRLPVWIEFESVALFFPFPPSPVLPPMPSLVLALGCGMAFILFWRRIPGVALGVVVASLPIFFAAINEPFWLASRYLAVPQLVLFLGIGRYLEKRESKYEILTYCAVCMGICLACFYLGDYRQTIHASYHLSEAMLQHPQAWWWEFKGRANPWK